MTRVNRGPLGTALDLVDDDRSPSLHYGISVRLSPPGYHDGQRRHRGDALNRFLPSVVLPAMIAIAGTAHGQAREPSLEELEMEQRINQASRAFEKQDLPIEEISADFRYRCLRATGDATFCECLVEKRPYTLRFEQYVGISSRTKPELDYDSLSDFSKEIVDKVFLVRNECVGDY